jgi:hypothetical protein
MAKQKKNTKPENSKEDSWNEDKTVQTDTASEIENTAPEENIIKNLKEWVTWLQGHPVFIILAILGAILTFFLKTGSMIFEKSKGAISDSSQIFDTSKNRKWSNKMQITYPELSGKNNSIEQIIVNKVISYLEKHNAGEFKTYEDLDYFLDGYQSNNPDASLYMNIVIHEDKSHETDTGLSKYLYISFLRLTPSRKDTLSLDFINFDFEKKQELKLNDMFLGVSILKQLIEEKFWGKPEIEGSFVDGFFHLSPNFVLTNDAIEFHYFYKKGGEWKQKKSYKLVIPYDSVKSVINYNSKLKFLRNKTN